ncbi:glucokinase [Nitrosomonas sp. HPC101]|uniref:glucokinase n=1 Tax=Nitrosomonas sp. HPC101 TaxID=1658667 RepID=UPI00136A8FD8|nr:glucokinase [Nitrosomonas sp. HPC101]MXS86147.1 glucokinase [Nitrosomonas sp. HPC101]
MDQYLLYGDIGGTKTLLRSAVIKNEKAQLHFEHRYDSREYGDFDSILEDFLQRSGCQPVAVCLAVAGPIVDQQVHLTNLPWMISAPALAEKFQIPAVKIVNDFEGTAASIEILPQDDLVVLQAGKPSASAMRVVLGAGTGMGVAWLIKRGQYYEPLATEAGHVDFAPTSAIQIELLKYLMTKYQRVSIERLLSGQGLTHIFNFLQADAEAGSHLKSIALDGDDGATVTRLAFEHQYPLALQALELFSGIYGAYAGDLALAGLCRGGVYIAGGIAPRIIQILQQSGFIEAFCNKGRYSGLVCKIPVYVVMNPKAGLLGAGLLAQRMLHPPALSLTE